MPTPNQILFFDTTLRDGEQSPGCTMHSRKNCAWPISLRILASTSLKPDSPSPPKATSFRPEIARQIKGPRIASLARCKREDIEAAARALQPATRNRIHVFLASSDLHLEYKLRMSREEALDQAAESVRLARTFIDDVEFSTEDGTRTDPEFLIEMVTVAVEAGATTINIPDTVGYTTPPEYEAIFRKVQAHVPGSKTSSSLRTVTTISAWPSPTLSPAIQAGARQVECTINGIGERAGNAALEEIAAALLVRQDRFPYTNNIKMEQLYSTSQVLGEFITFRPSPNKAIVGANAFAHESGIHQHGMLANPLSYEIMTPTSVGVSRTNLVLGKHSGRRALASSRELGYTLHATSS